MKAWIEYRLCIWLCFVVFATAMIAQSNAESGLKSYTASKTEIRAGFIPCKSSFVLGEPLQVAFLVENLGPTNFVFWFGGDYRGSGRHDRFKISAINASGESLSDPRPASFFGGGVSSELTLKPGRFFTNVIDLSDFRVMTNPGVYNVGCRYAFDRPSGPTVNSSFSLTVLDRTPEHVAEALDEMVAKAQTLAGQDLADELALIASFGKDDAVPRLSQLAQKGPPGLRAAAIAALPSIPTETSYQIILNHFKDSDPEIRVAAAGALGATQKPEAVTALLRALPGEQEPVSEAILRALGASKSDRAYSVITNILETGGIKMQCAAIDALGGFGGSNAVAILQGHINTNYLSLRYPIVLTLAETLCQPIHAQWLAPVLMGRKQNSDWLDTLRLLRLYGGDEAIPTMLSCLDFDVAWSGRNWWILNEVEACPHAPTFDYIYNPNTDGDPEQRTNNLRTLQKLRKMAGPIPVDPPRPPRVIIPYLRTDPPVDFTPDFRITKDGGVEIKSGFLTATIYRWLENYNYAPAESYQPIYQLAARLRALPNTPPEKLEKLGVTPLQMKQLLNLLSRFARKLGGADASDQETSNFFNSLVYGPENFPSFSIAGLVDYQETPPRFKQDAQADLIDSFRALSQNYHAGTVELVEAAKQIFTAQQQEQILK